MSASLSLVAPQAPAQWTEDDIKALHREQPQAAMEMVVRKFRGRLFYHASCITKDSQEAYDVVQEVFIRAMRERRFYDAEFRQKAWLYRVTSNLCFNLVRNRKRRGAILETVPRKERDEGDQLDRVFRGEQREEILAAIDQMTDAHKEILLLRYYDDLSYAEIAAVLDVKLGTVMSRLSRARRRLVDVLEPIRAD
ncbi:MAG: RNA polymerase sigma factor [Oligoflexia bacterium]|nr:RNA polymerase sigma factor [Oligoflexia bacterium]